MQYDCAYFDLKEAEERCHSHLVVDRFILTKVLLLAARRRLRYDPLIYIQAHLQKLIIAELSRITLARPVTHIDEAYHIQTNQIILRDAG